jgi:hypothetical protein
MVTRRLFKLAYLSTHPYPSQAFDVRSPVMDTHTNPLKLTRAEIRRFTTAGGRIVCRRCNATSKRTKVQCGGPAMQGKTKCKFHGGLSTGPRTKQGKLRCAQAKTIHGKDTRVDRQVHRLAMKRLRLYAQILGVPFRSDAGDKRL